MAWPWPRSTTRAPGRRRCWSTAPPGVSFDGARVIKIWSAARRSSRMLTLRGSMTAVVTPFRGGAVDEAALRALCRWQIESGTDALVPCGTTGEGATLSAEEHARVIRACVEEARGKVPVIA